MREQPCFEEITGIGIYKQYRLVNGDKEYIKFKVKDMVSGEYFLYNSDPHLLVILSLMQEKFYFAYPMANGGPCVKINPDDEFILLECVGDIISTDP